MEVGSIFFLLNLTFSLFCNNPFTSATIPPTLVINCQDFFSFMKKTCSVCGAGIESHVCEDCLDFYSHKFRTSKNDLFNCKSFKKLIHIYKQLPEGGGKNNEIPNNTAVIHPGNAYSERSRNGNNEHRRQSTV